MYKVWITRDLFVLTNQVDTTSTGIPHCSTSFGSMHRPVAGFGRSQACVEDVGNVVLVVGVVRIAGVNADWLSWCREKP